MKDIMQSVYFEKILDPVDNTGTGAATLPAAYINVSDYDYFGFLISTGVMDGTIDAKVVQATAASDGGSDSKDVSGAAITQIPATGDADQVSITVETRKLDINNGFNYVALTLTEDSSTGQLCDVWFYAYNAGEEPVTQHTDFNQQVFVGG